jgi:ferredoxin--NADP+ reductase|tara:strand:+ start:505 stop:1347 length:843 start_codon:yes stop_codon:yes gene_type:complete
MYLITKKQKLAENIYLMEIEAPKIVKKAHPGHFIILRIDEKGERIPLTIADYDKKTLTIVFLVVGETTEQLSQLRKGDHLLDVVGPLGNKSEIDKISNKNEIGNFGTVCMIGGGLGIAPIYPIARALKRKKNKIITIIGARSKEFLFWEDRLKKVSDKVIVCTDNGTKGKKGFVTSALVELMENEYINRVIVIGPPIMMKNVSNITRDRIRTVASLNPIMVDGMGMCGGCRVVIDDNVQFACCDGPEFNAHKVDWDEMINRNKAYMEEEESCKVDNCKKN